MVASVNPGFFYYYYFYNYYFLMLLLLLLQFNITNKIIKSSSLFPLNI